jgi:hypothetical protein
VSSAAGDEVTASSDVGVASAGSGHGGTERVRLAVVLRAHPWLDALPDELLRRLHVEELLPGHPATEALGPSVVAYSTSVPPDPAKVSLCSILRPAPIDPERLSRLVAAEQRWPGIALVEYTPPRATGPASG